MIIIALFGCLLGLCITSVVQRLPEPLPLPLWLKGITITLSSISLTAFALGHVDSLNLLLLLMSLMLSLYDSQTQSFPLIVWLAFLPVTLFLGEINLLVVLLFLVGILAELIDLKIGSGDIFYLATLCLAISLQELLWVVQVASLMGISHIILRKKEGRIAFLPCLSMGYVLILLFSSRLLRKII